MWQALLAAIPGLISAGGGIADLFRHKSKPGTAAGQTLDQIPGKVNPYYQPYIDAGKGLPEDLRNRYKDMLDNPNATYDKLASGYKQSPGYANTMREAMTGANQASAGGGMLGTPQHMQQSAQIAGNVADKDFETYLNHMFGINDKGLAGEEGINDKAYGAGTDYASILANIQQQKAGLNYADTADRNAGRSNAFGNIGTGAGAAFKQYYDYVNSLNQGKGGTNG